MTTIMTTIMTTNEEKAKELLNCKGCYFYDRPNFFGYPPNPCETCGGMKAVLGMASFKDAIIELLNKELQESNDIIAWLQQSKSK